MTRCFFNSPFLLSQKKYDEREQKFKSLTATISASMAKATPGKSSLDSMGLSLVFTFLARVSEDSASRTLQSLVKKLSVLAVRQTKLAYVDSMAKPPRNVARQQAKHGTGVPSAVPVRPADRLVTRPLSSSPNVSAVPVSRPPPTTPAIPKSEYPSFHVLRR